VLIELVLEPVYGLYLFLLLVVLQPQLRTSRNLVDRIRFTVIRVHSIRRKEGIRKDTYEVPSHTGLGIRGLKVFTKLDGLSMVALCILDASTPQIVKAKLRSSGSKITIQSTS